jgi:hypothetical protein
VISSDDGNEVPYRPQQLLRALWRAVEAVVIRPVDRSGRRVAVEAPRARWEAAFQHCQREHIAAWFSVGGGSPAPTRSAGDGSARTSTQCAPADTAGIWWCPPARRSHLRTH